VEEIGPFLTTRPEQRHLPSLDRNQEAEAFSPLWPAGVDNRLHDSLQAQRRDFV
jgi:hypothetical protein